MSHIIEKRRGFWGNEPPAPGQENEPGDNEGRMVIDASLVHFRTARVTLSISDCAIFERSNIDDQQEGELVVEGNVDVCVNFWANEHVETELELDIVLPAVLFRRAQPGIWVEKIETVLGDPPFGPGDPELSVRVGLSQEVFNRLVVDLSENDGHSTPLEEQIEIGGMDITPLSPENPLGGFFANFTYCRVYDEEVSDSEFTLH